MYRKIRIAVAAVCFTLITLLFLDFTGILHLWFGWLAKAQLLPAIMAVNVVVISLLLLITLLLGRVYCSVICPLGVMQDLFARLGKLRKKHRYTYSPAISWLRYAVLAVVVVAALIGLQPLVALLDPYSAFGRIAQGLLAPLWAWANNALAYMAERADSYAFYEVEVWLKGGITLAVAIATLLVLAVLSWRNGRTYCNTICPVGTTLGLLSRFSLLRIQIDASNCTNCGQCVKNCKASCIDLNTHQIDHSRCVTCMNCLGKC